MAEYSSKFSRGTYLSLVLASQGSFEVVPRESCCRDSLHVMLCGIQRIERRKLSCVQCKEYSFEFNLCRYLITDVTSIASNVPLILVIYYIRCKVKSAMYVLCTHCTCSSIFDLTICNMISTFL